MSNLEIQWLGQAGFIYRFPQGIVVCIDPYLSYATSSGKTRERLMPVVVPPSQVCADIVVTTHDHTDHFDEHTLRPMAEQSETIFVGPSSCREHWRAMEMPAWRFVRLDRGESLDIAGIKLTALYAEHDSRDKRDAIGVLLEADGLRIYQVGDSEYAEPLLQAARDLRPDLLVVPFNGRFGNMNAREAALFTQAVQPRAVIPMHYGMFRNNNAHPQDFVDACRELRLATRVIIVKAGIRFQF
ncbi:MAG: MBL fold metallo-hydrolase [Chloroflexi bacterium]|nr:MBL fold metallo-hydrolase [Chloroflexota bacterium]